MSCHVAVAVRTGLLAMGAALVVACGPSTGGEAVPMSRAPIAIDSAARAPEGTRVRVQVLNGSGRTGLARRATQQLRDHGYDVVDYRSQGDSSRVTEVLVTAATRAWGERVQKALGGGAVRERDGGLGYVDVVVLLGHDWKAPPQPLRP